MKKNKSNINKNVFWMGIVSYFNDFSSEMLKPILPIFFSDVLGINKASIGLIEGFAESFSSFMKIVSGYISDKIKRRKIFLIIGYSLPAIVKPFYIFASGWVHIFLLRFVERSGKGFRDPPRDALIAASSERKHFGQVFGFQRAMDTIGAVSGVLALSTILYFAPNTLKPLFLMAFVPGFISFVIAGTKVKDDKKLKNNKHKIKIKAIKKLPKIYLFFLIPTFFFAIGNMSYAFFILRAENLGLSITLIPPIYLIYTITYAVFALPAGHLADKIGKIPTIILGNFFFFAACTLYISQLPSSLIWIVFVLYGMFFAFNVGASKAYVSDIVPETLRGTALGIHNFILGICALPASFIVGYLWETTNVAVAFGYSATLTVISTILYTFMLFHPKGRVR